MIALVVSGAAPLTEWMLHGQHLIGPYASRNALTIKSSLARVAFPSPKRPANVATKAAWSDRDTNWASVATITGSILSSLM